MTGWSVGRIRQSTVVVRSLYVLTSQVPFDLNTLGSCDGGLVNMAGPILTNTPNQTDDTNASVSLQIEATDADGDWPFYTATGLPQGLSISENSGLISGTPTLEGDYDITVTADDGRNLSDTISFDWTISAVAPPPPPPPPPPPQPASTGGGGSGAWLLLLLLPVARRRKS